MRLWYKPIRTQRAWESWRDASPPGSIQSILPSGAQGSALPQGAMIAGEDEPYIEQRYQFWMAKPWRWRIVQSALADPSSSAAPQQVMVIDGAKWWSWTAGNAVYTNAQSAHPTQARHAGVDRALLVMLEPAPLVGALRMRVAASAEEIGRPGDSVICTTRDPQSDPGLWPGADEYKLLVEHEHGILLRAEAQSVGGVFASAAFTELTLNEPIPDDRYVFQLPTGVTVHNM